jgi:hypothetical protein
MSVTSSLCVIDDTYASYSENPSLRSQFESLRRFPHCLQASVGQISTHL